MINNQQKSAETFLRDAWRWTCGLPPVPEESLPTLEELRKSEWNPEFEQLQRNRLLVGHFRYGGVHNRHSGKHDRISSMLRRLELYNETGNDELLVDLANLAMVEFTIGIHPKKHFASVDDGEHMREE